MSNILKVTTPIPGYDSANQVRTGPVRTTDPAIQGQVNPEKVMKPDARSDSASQEQNVGLKFQFESNYDNFIKQMLDSPVLTEGFSKLFFRGLGTLAESGMREGIAQEIAEFFRLIEMHGKDLAALLKGQGDASVKFGGAFFTLLRQVMNESSSVELKAGILDFLRRYTDMAEGPHVMENVRQVLKEIKGQMFQDGREKLSEMEQGLVYQAGAGSKEMQANAKLLKSRILPFLNIYISRTHERGELRDMTAMLAAYAARCDNGTGERLLDAFSQLMKYQIMQKYFQGFGQENLLQVLSNTEYEKTNRKQKWMEEFAKLIGHGLDKGADAGDKAVFRNMMRAILLNESVYMPVLHIMLPVQVDGRQMFAEMWLDPDAEGAGEQQADGKDAKKAIQGLVKFDIRDVGFFDLYFVYQAGAIQIQLNCPEKFREQIPEIRNEVARIMAENSIKTNELFVETGQEPVAVSDAFPKIFERRNAVNVRI